MIFAVLIPPGENKNKSENMGLKMFGSIPKDKMTSNQAYMLSLFSFLIAFNGVIWTAHAFGDFPEIIECKITLYITLLLFVIVIVTEQFARVKKNKR